MRDKIIFDRDLHNYLKQLSVEDFAEAFCAICEYAFYDILPPKGSMRWYTVQILSLIHISEPTRH